MFKFHNLLLSLFPILVTIFLTLNSIHAQLPEYIPPSLPGKFAYTISLPKNNTRYVGENATITLQYAFEKILPFEITLLDVYLYSTNGTQLKSIIRNAPSEEGSYRITKKFAQGLESGNYFVRFNETKNRGIYFTTVYLYTDIPIKPTRMYIVQHQTHWLKTCLAYTFTGGGGGGSSSSSSSSSSAIAATVATVATAAAAAATAAAAADASAAVAVANSKNCHKCEPIKALYNSPSITQGVNEELQGSFNDFHFFHFFHFFFSVRWDDFIDNNKKDVWETKMVFNSQEQQDTHMT
ncbi:hypothetical protein G9A89_017973 [Geosiphon pyriformis]|nr:hypothetical protein G9A89_017973 [Geosiphon pyriformis]